MKINKENLDKCVRDLKKIIEIDKMMIGLEHMKNNKETNLINYIDYIIDNRIVSSLEEVFYLAQQLPEIHEIMANCIRKSTKRGEIVELKYYDTSNTINSSNAINSYPHCKTYNSLREVPGYGSEWNERCIPNDVIINRPNDRC